MMINWKKRIFNSLFGDWKHSQICKLESYKELKSATIGNNVTILQERENK